MKWALIVWSVCASLLVLLALFGLRTNRTDTHVFCAYGRVFVEFEEDGKRWGTIMLDYDGRPIPCREEGELQVENTI